MNIRRYFGRTNRDALAALRKELGPEAVVLRNQAVEGGVELFAMAADALPAVGGARRTAPKPAAPTAPAAPAAPEPRAAEQHAAGPQAGARAEPPPPEMSTLSFQEYVRERLARRAAAAHEAAAGAGTGGVHGGKIDPAPQQRDPRTAVERQMAEDAAGRAGAAAERAAAGQAAADRSAAAERPAAGQAVAGRGAAAEQIAGAGGAEEGAAGRRVQRLEPAGEAASVAAVRAASEVAARAASASAARAAGAAAAGVQAELRELRSFVAEQLGALAWFDGARQSASKARLVAWLLRAGFSPALVRVVLGRIPADWSVTQSTAWIRRALAHNLLCAPAESPLERGGVYALVGPTGVGKTTTTAKLAARFALVHGVDSVGLITVDAYRIGGRDQLRSFGLMLGVPVHVAHDAATLADLLRLFRGKKLVLIDTAGLGQRDQRVERLLAALSAPVVRKLVVLNATAQLETLDDVACAYRAQSAAGVVITKIDEAARLGGVVDCALRHRLRLVGVADGQRVPEDWHAPVAQTLVDRALAVPQAAAFDLQRTESEVLMAGAGAPAAEVARSAHV